MHMGPLLSALGFLGSTAVRFGVYRVLSGLEGLEGLSGL